NSTSGGNSGGGSGASTGNNSGGGTSGGGKATSGGTWVEPQAEPVLVALAVRQPVVPGAEVQTARANQVILLASSAQTPTGALAVHSETTSPDLSRMVDGS